MRYLLLVILAGCATGQMTAPARLGDGNVKVVTAVWPSMDTPPLSAESWRRSGWHCASQLLTPAMVIVSGNMACVLDESIVDVPLRGDNFRCPHRWVPPSNAC